MQTQRVRGRDSIARIALFGALALTVVFGAFALESVQASRQTADAQHARIIRREAKTTAVAATSTKSRGNAWVASLFAAATVAALAAHLLGTDRAAGYRRNLGQFSVRLRAPPSLHVAH